MPRGAKAVKELRRVVCRRDGKFVRKRPLQPVGGCIHRVESMAKDGYDRHLVADTIGGERLQVAGIRDESSEEPRVHWRRRPGGALLLVREVDGGDT